MFAFAKAHRPRPRRAVSRFLTDVYRALDGRTPSPRSASENKKKQATRLLFLFLISAQSLKNESEPTANVPIT